MRIVMMGTGTFAGPTFAALLAAGENVVGLVTQPDRDPGRRTGATRQTGEGLAAAAAEAGVPVARPVNINTPEGLGELAAFAPDLCVVAAYGQILKPAVIATPRLGMINVHASLLPKYRGAAPVAHAILGGETRTGVTIIRITPGLDAGAMLAKGELEIAPDETAGELEARLAPVGAELAVEVVRRMKAGPVPGTPQDPAGATKAPKLTKEMGLVDWSRPAIDVSRQVRAMQPWPTAYTYLRRPGKEPMRVLIAKVAIGGLAVGTPGSITGPGLTVAVGGGESVEIIDLQPAGKKRLPAAEFLRGYPVQPGFSFGPEAAV